MFGRHLVLKHDLFKIEIYVPCTPDDDENTLMKIAKDILLQEIDNITFEEE